MKIIGPGFLIPFPGRTAERCFCLIGKLPRLSFPPYIIVSVFTASVLFRLQKPGMFVGRMVDHHIHHDLNVPFARLCYQHFHIRQCAELLMNVIIIADVISIVILGRLVHRGQPDHIDAKLPEIIQSADDTRNISDTVPVGVLKAPGINLIHNRMFPPFCLFHAFLPFFSVH